MAVQVQFGLKQFLVVVAIIPIMLGTRICHVREQRLIVCELIEHDTDFLAPQANKAVAAHRCGWYGFD